MDNNPSNVSNTKENEENDEENKAPILESINSSSVQENQEYNSTAITSKKDNKSEKDIAKNVEGVPTFEYDNGIIDDVNHDDGEGDTIINNKNIIDPQTQTSNASDISFHVDDNDDEKEESINYQHHSTSLEPSSTPEDLVRDWEHLHNAILAKKLREFALLVAAIHLDENSRGITVKDIKVLMNCPTIDAAERRKDEAVNRDLLVAYTSLKEGKQKLYFLSNYLHVFNEKRKKRLLEQPHLLSPDDITLIFINVLSERQCAYHHIYLKTRLKYPDEDYKRLDGTI